MKKNKTLLGLSILFLILLSIILLSSFNVLPGLPGNNEINSETETHNQTPDSEPENLGPLHVVPEVPFGTIGIFSAIVLALGVTILKKRETH